MGAPEKIYLKKNLLGELFNDWDALPSENFISIEYIRTDYAEKVFLHTVNAWLAEIHRVCDITDENGYQIGLEKLQASFKRYVKEK